VRNTAPYVALYHAPIHIEGLRETPDDLVRIPTEPALPHTANISDDIQIFAMVTSKKILLPRRLLKILVYKRVMSNTAVHKNQRILRNRPRGNPRWGSLRGPL
jgi:hypothetical protein